MPAHNNSVPEYLLHGDNVIRDKERFPGVLDLSVVNPDLQHLLWRRADLANLLLAETQKSSLRRKRNGHFLHPKHNFVIVKHMWAFHWSSFCWNFKPAWKFKGKELVLSDFFKGSEEKDEMLKRKMYLYSRTVIPNTNEHVLSRPWRRYLETEVTWQRSGITC